MGTLITTLVKRAGSVLASLPVFRPRSYDTTFTYDRTDGKRVEFALIHIPNVAGDAVKPPYLALTARNIRRNPNHMPNELINFSMEEARLLRDYLNHPDVACWLEEEEEA